MRFPWPRALTLAALASSLLLMASCSPLPSSSSPPSIPLGDSCLLHTWTLTHKAISAFGNQVSMQGQAGTTLTFQSSGQGFFDYDASQPLVATNTQNATQTTITYRGSASFTAKATNNALAFTPTSSTQTEAAAIVGGPSSSPIPVAANQGDASIPTTYTCSPTTLTLHQTTPLGPIDSTWTSRPFTPSPVNLTPTFDACLGGSWTLTAVTAQATYQGSTLNFSGLQGTTLQVTPDGTETINYAAAQPWATTYQGSPLAYTYSGSPTYTIQTLSGRLSLRLTSQGPTVTTSYYADMGIISLPGDPLGGGASGSGTYTCTSTSLLLHISGDNLPDQVAAAVSMWSRTG